jgi:ribosomal protein L3
MLGAGMLPRSRAVHRRCANTSLIAGVGACEAARYRTLGPTNNLVHHDWRRSYPEVMQERWRDMYHSYYPYLFEHADKMSLYPDYPTNPREWQPSQLITTYDAVREDKFDGFMKLREKFPELYQDTQAWDKPPPFGEYNQFYSRRFGMIGTKAFTTVEFDDHGNKVELTALWCPDNQVVGHKTQERDGYDGVVLGAMNVPVEFHKPYVTATYKAARVPVKHVSTTFRITPDAFAPVGSKLDVRHFRVGQEVDLSFQETDFGNKGVMTRLGHDGGPVWLGDSKWQRRVGSVGQEGTKRIFPGKVIGGQTGGRISYKFHKTVYRIDYKNALVYVLGSFDADVGSYFKMTDIDNLHQKTAFNEVRGKPAFPTFVPPKDEDLNALTTDECQLVSEPVWRYFRDEPRSVAKIAQQDIDDAKRSGSSGVAEKKKAYDYHKWLADRRKFNKENREKRKATMKVKRVWITEKQNEARRKKLMSRRKVK